ncbi:MAG: hypothetical protein PQ612_06580 [Rickettsiales bacterium]|nr:hypothetical protein [Pseudomonadota bacterium]MDA0966639.1 hypothetical protein [Pseudomonadota bacterium]MDG4543667.1 hypothetical protein [Rickettsiales bacterium]MDG4545814.1 hypothetical protein [Rickettsiales bacterium]MDG4547412.1 hypothetical protein [Rickettsiales bacterium]
MKKIILVIVFAILALPVESFAKNENNDNDILNPLSPEKVDRVLDTVAEEAKKNAPGVKEYYDQYMVSLKRFANEMADAFKDFF